VLVTAREAGSLVSHGGRGCVARGRGPGRAGLGVDGFEFGAELAGEGLPQLRDFGLSGCGSKAGVLEVDPKACGTHAVRGLRGLAQPVFSLVGLLLDSRDEPWSTAGRLAHRLLREAKITGWKGNLAVRCRGRLYYLDIAFEGGRLAIEIDGRLHEDDPAIFENDRLRQNDLAVSGWQGSAVHLARAGG